MAATYGLRRLATEGKVNGVRTIDGIIPGIGLIATTKELILDLIGMPRASLGVGLAELAFIARTRCTGLTFRAGEGMERRRQRPVEIIVSVVRLPTVRAFLAGKGRVVRPSINNDRLPLRLGTSDPHMSVWTK